jgi:tetratricopeptide (TPR) repeat protein
VLWHQRAPIVRRRIESCGSVIAAGRDRKDVEQAYFRRGLVRAATGDHDGAIEDYGQAIELRVAPRYFESRGEAYAFKGDDAAALSDFARVVELEPTNSSPHLSIGGIHLGRGDDALAVQSFILVEPIRETGMEDCRLDELERPEHHPAAVDRLAGDGTDRALTVRASSCLAARSTLYARPA